MRFAVYIILIAVIIGTLGGIFNSLLLYALAPNIFLLIVISMALGFYNLDYLFFSTLGGLWMEIAWGMPIGSLSLPLTIAGTISSAILQKWLLLQVSLRHYIFMVLGFTVFYLVWVWLYTSILFALNFSSIVFSFSQMLSVLPRQLVVNLILAYPVYSIIDFTAQSVLRLKTTTFYKV